MQSTNPWLFLQLPLSIHFKLIYFGPLIPDNNPVP